MKLEKSAALKWWNEELGEGINEWKWGGHLTFPCTMTISLVYYEGPFFSVH
jgi:hypothetical protein